MYKALKSFSGIKISMAKGQEKEITDPVLIQDLLRAGYIEEIIVNDEIKEISEEVKEDISKENIAKEEKVVKNEIKKNGKKNTRKQKSSCCSDNSK